MIWVPSNRSKLTSSYSWLLFFAGIHLMRRHLLVSCRSWICVFARRNPSRASLDMSSQRRPWLCASMRSGLSVNLLFDLGRSLFHRRLPSCSAWRNSKEDMMWTLIPSTMRCSNVQLAVDSSMTLAKAWGAFQCAR